MDRSLKINNDKEHFKTFTNLIGLHLNTLIFKCFAHPSLTAGRFYTIFVKKLSSLLYFVFFDKTFVIETFVSRNNITYQIVAEYFKYLLKLFRI